VGRPRRFSANAEILKNSRGLRQILDDGGPFSARQLSFELAQPSLDVEASLALALGLGLRLLGLGLRLLGLGLRLLGLGLRRCSTLAARQPAMLA